MFSQIVVKSLIQPSPQRILFYTFCLPAILLCLGCTSSYRNELQGGLGLAESWQTEAEEESEIASWSAFIRAPALEQLLLKALEANPALTSRRLDVDIEAATLFQKNMQYWPSLDLRFNANRQNVENRGGNIAPSDSVINNFSLSTNLSYELNLWGQLSDEKRAAAFGFSAAKSEYEAAMRDLVVNVSTAWLNLVENQQLVSLRAERLNTLEKNLYIIESGYRSGLNQALEVYLARNDVEGERSRLLQQQQSLSESQRAIAVLLGQYPQHSTTQALTSFPESNTVTPPTMPATLLARRPDIQSAWLRVLQQNSSLAVAHKARFPRVSISASGTKGALEVGSIGGSQLAWSLGGSLIQPLINAGQLKSAEDVARFRLKQLEQTYLDTVYQAFQEVENALQSQVNLEARLSYTQISADNAVQAETLSFEQYQRGLAAYSTVLESQRRSLDAQIELISLKKQIIVNKVNLLNAVGGKLDFVDISPIPQEVAVQTDANQ